jgi:hypothetical protein
MDVNVFTHTCSDLQYHTSSNDIPCQCSIQAELIFCPQRELLISSLRVSYVALFHLEMFSILYVSVLLQDLSRLHDSVFQLKTLQSQKLN